jgi:hypothetical protein
LCADSLEAACDFRRELKDFFAYNFAGSFASDLEDSELIRVYGFAAFGERLISRQEPLSEFSEN